MLILLYFFVLIFTLVLIQMILDYGAYKIKISCFKYKQKSSLYLVYEQIQYSEQMPNLSKIKIFYKNIFMKIPSISHKATMLKTINQY